MSLKLLHKGTEEERGWKIIDVSKSRDKEYLPQLHAMLRGRETNTNKRHAIRALANIGSDDSKTLILELLESEQGLILGELCRAVKSLALVEAIEPLKLLIEHHESWVQQEAISALNKLKAISV